MEESTGGFGRGGFRSASHTSHCSLSSPFAAASRRCPSLSFPAASGSARAARPSPPAYQGRTTEAYGFGMLRNPSFCFAFVPGEGALTPRQPPVRGVHLEPSRAENNRSAQRNTQAVPLPPPHPPLVTFSFADGRVASRSTNSVSRQEFSNKQSELCRSALSRIFSA